MGLIPPLKWLRDGGGVMQVREGEMMARNDWDTNVSTLYILHVSTLVCHGRKLYAVVMCLQLALKTAGLDPLTQLTPRTLEGSLDLEISKVRVLPVSTNPREGWKAQLKGGTAQVLVDELSELKRIDRSVILDYNGYLPSVSADRLSKRASFELLSAGGAALSLSVSSRPSSSAPCPSDDSHAPALVQEEQKQQEEEREEGGARARPPSALRPASGERGGGPQAIKGTEAAHGPKQGQEGEEEGEDDEWREEEEEEEEEGDLRIPRPASGQSRPVSRGRPSSRGGTRLEDIEDNDLNVDIFQFDSNYPNNEQSLERKKRGVIGIRKGGSFYKGSSTSAMDRPSYHESFDEIPPSSAVEGVEEGSVFSVSAAEERLVASAQQALIHAPPNKLEASSSASIDVPSRLEAAQSFTFPNEGVGPEGDVARELEDDVILDGNAALKHIGRPNRRNVHSLNMRSVYEGYSSGAEPVYTESTPVNAGGHGARCSDYIFYSQHALAACRLLSIPPLSQLKGDDPRQPVAVIDSNWKAPPPALTPYFNRHNSLGVDPSILMDAKLTSAHTVKIATQKAKAHLKQLIETSTQASPLYGGSWAYFTSYNPERTHSWLPNEYFASTHISLCAEFFVVDEYAAVEWI